ncbi:GntR family transcriptional regulator [Kitasatospora sp. NPDC127059]|uniref:GntR family transcriptional regulator n=1 Tax=Kitasatospora sp. NPDC127059 TaxID=3347120 RepID=UPI00364C95F8
MSHPTPTTPAPAATAPAATAPAGNTDPLSRVPLGEQVRGLLLEGLLGGRWQPGDRIVERRLAAELNVSQAPVREALRSLQTLGLLDAEPNRGVRVREIGPAELREVHQVRAALERPAAEAAVVRLAGDTRALERHAELTAAAAAAGDTLGQARHGVAFHREIVAASGNGTLLRTWEGLGVEVWTVLSLHRVRPELHENAADHLPLIEAFRRRDPEVGRLLAEHVLEYADRSA